MADTYTQLSDTYNAHEGKAYVTINGSNRLMFELSKWSAHDELTVAEKRLLGNRYAQHKVTGVKGAGSMTIYHMTSDMAAAVDTYRSTGVFPGLTVTVIEDDPASSIGTQEVAYYNVIPAQLPSSMLDDSSDDPATFDTDFTYDRREVLSKFSTPSNFQ